MFSDPDHNATLEYSIEKNDIIMVDKYTGSIMPKNVWKRYINAVYKTCVSGYLWLYLTFLFRQLHFPANLFIVSLQFICSANKVKLLEKLFTMNSKWIVSCWAANFKFCLAEFVVHFIVFAERVRLNQCPNIMYLKCAINFCEKFSRRAKQRLCKMSFHLCARWWQYYPEFDHHWFAGYS